MGFYRSNLTSTPFLDALLDAEVREQLHHHFITDILVSAPKLKPVDAKIYLRRRFEEIYGLYDHSRDTERLGFSMSTYHNLLETPENSLFHRIARLYVNKGIRELFGCSLPELLRMPGWEIDHLFDVAEKVNAAQQPVTKALHDMAKKERY